jgi:hypothetical protein
MAGPGCCTWFILLIFAIMPILNSIPWLIFVCKNRIAYRLDACVAWSGVIAMLLSILMLLIPPFFIVPHIYQFVAFIIIMSKWGSYSRWKQTHEDGPASAVYPGSVGEFSGEKDTFLATDSGGGGGFSGNGMTVGSLHRGFK